MIEGVGQGSHCVSSYAEKLSLLSLERTVEQRPPLRGRGLPISVRGAWLSPGSQPGPQPQSRGG